MIKVYNNISREEFSYKLIDLLNVLRIDDFKLTPKETMFIVNVMLLPEKYKFGRFTTGARKYLIKKLSEQNWKISPQHYSILVRSLEKKGIIYEDTDGVKYLHKSFNSFMDETIKNYKFQFEFNL